MKTTLKQSTLKYILIKQGNIKLKEKISFSSPGQKQDVTYKENKIWLALDFARATLKIVVKYWSKKSDKVKTKDFFFYPTLLRKPIFIMVKFT